jgi:transposase
MDILTDSHQISRLEVVDTGRWTEKEKLRIVAESLSGSRMASATARRHGISRQQIFAWRRLHREGRLGVSAGFVPVTITPQPSTPMAEPGGGRIEIVSRKGRRIIIDRGADIDSGLEALP